MKPGRLLPLKLINMEPHRDQKRPESCSRNFLDWSENAVMRVLHEAKLLFMKLGMQRLEDRSTQCLCVCQRCSSVLCIEELAVRKRRLAD